ncbi:MAG: hypothetical protein LBR37_00055, partial [Erysipelotrichaceae bacterium]|nr:hypothetical protein [Erysipelotrichaceae bacterium]
LEQNRRLYDSAFYSEHPVPYSMMNEKTLKLQKIVDEGKLTYAKLNTYLKSLKQDAETAFNEIQPLYIALKEMEHKAASFSDITAQKIFDFVGDSYLKLGKLQGILKTVPLNITLVNELYQQLKAAVTSETIAITTLLTQKKAAMERLVFLNRARLDETVLDNATRDFERLFFDDHFGEIISKSEAFYKILREKKPIFEIE